MSRSCTSCVRRGRAFHASAGIVCGALFFGAITALGTNPWTSGNMTTRLCDTGSYAGEANDGTSYLGQLGTYHWVNAMSANGRYLVFQTDYALVDEGNPNDNEITDVYLRDVQSTTLTLVSDPAHGGHEGVISGDGLHVLYVDTYDGQLYHYEVASGVRACLTRDMGCWNGIQVYARDPTIDAGPPPTDPNGICHFAFVAYGSGCLDRVEWPGTVVYGTIWDAAGALSVSVTLATPKVIDPSTPAPAEYPSISANGSVVAFVSSYSQMIGETLPCGAQNELQYGEIFVYDSGDLDHPIKWVSEGFDGCLETTYVGGPPADVFSPNVSSNGRYVVWISDAYNIVNDGITSPGDVILKDRNTGVTRRITKNTSGGAANYASSYPSISSSGRFIAFTSYASNLVSGDTNSVQDVFVYDRDVSNDGTYDQAGDTQMLMVDRKQNGDLADANANSCCISGNGTALVMGHEAALTTSDTAPYVRNIFARGPYNSGGGQGQLAGEGSRFSIETLGEKLNAWAHAFLSGQEAQR